MPDSKWTYPDGSSVTEHEDGSVTVKDANGSQTHYDPKTGKRTETGAPPNGQKTETTPPLPPQEDAKEIKITYPDGTRVYIRKNPRRIKIIRSAPAKPREFIVELPTGKKTIQEDEGGTKADTQPTTPQPESITPSEHPKPAEPAPTPTPTPKPEGGGASKSKKKRKTPVKKKKPAKKNKKTARKR